MTGEEWLVSRDGPAMIRTLWFESRRKRFLYCLACATRITPLANDHRCELLMTLAENFLNGLVTEEDLWAVNCLDEQEGEANLKWAVSLVRDLDWQSCGGQANWDWFARMGGTASIESGLSSFENESRAQADLVREIMGW